MPTADLHDGTPSDPTPSTFAPDLFPEKSQPGDLSGTFPGAADELAELIELAEADRLAPPDSLTLAERRAEVVRELRDALLVARAELGAGEAVRVVVLWALDTCLRERGPHVPDAFGELDELGRPVVSFERLDAAGTARP
jgi:hypothetical protein